MEVWVKTLTGRSASVWAEAGDSVKVVKSKAEAAIGTAAGTQHRLFHRGATLKDSLPFSTVARAPGEFLILIGFIPKKKLVPKALEAPSTVEADAPFPDTATTSENRPRSISPERTVLHPSVQEESDTQETLNGKRRAVNGKVGRPVERRVDQLGPLSGGSDVGAARASHHAEIEVTEEAPIRQKEHEEQPTKSSVQQTKEQAVQDIVSNEKGTSSLNETPKPHETAEQENHQAGGAQNRSEDAPPVDMRAVQVGKSPSREAQRKSLFDSINALSQQKLPEKGGRKLKAGALNWAETGASAPLDGERTADIAQQEPQDEEEHGFWEERENSGALASTSESMYGREQARVRAKRDRRRGPLEMPGSIVGGLLEASAAIREGERQKAGQEEGLGNETQVRTRRRRVEDWSDDDHSAEEDRRAQKGARACTAVSSEDGGSLDSRKEPDNDKESLGEETGQGNRGRSAEKRVAPEKSGTRNRSWGSGRRRLQKVGGSNRQTSPQSLDEAETEQAGLLNGRSAQETEENIHEPSRKNKRRKLGVTFQDGAVVLDIKTGEGAEVNLGDDISTRAGDVSKRGSDVSKRGRQRKGPVIDLSDESEGGEKASEKETQKAAKQKAKKSAQAFDKLPLPQALARLERLFNALNVVYSFLQRQHVQPTWQNVRGAVRQTLRGDGSPVTSADVESLQALCPQVVMLRDFVGMRLTPEQKSKAAEQPKSTNGVNDGEVKIEMDEEEWVDGTETVTERSTEEDLDGDYSFTIDIVDPSRGPGSLQKIPVVTQDLQEDNFVSGGFKPIAQLKRQSDSQASSTIERRRRAFKSRLVELVGRLHQTWAANHPDPIEEGATSPADFDPWREGTWHPDFPLDDVTLPMALEASKQADAPAEVSKKRKLGFRRGLVSVTSGAKSLSDTDDLGDPQVAALLRDLSQQYGLDLGGRSSPSPDPPGADAHAQGAEEAAPPRPPQQLKHVPKCESTQNFDSEEMLGHLRTGLGSLGQIIHTEHMAVRQAQFMAPEARFSGGVKAVLGTKGLNADQLFTHQAKAINAAMSGRNVVVATSTASGKSLCYNVPVLEAILEGHQTRSGVDNQACALYLFPTKALAQDQFRALQELTAPLPNRPRVCVYDGDTPFSDRPEMRENAEILITNPDMLHVAMLPAHKSFQRILSSLRYVVVDEAHAYGGVFGCHTALILRRLRRVCSQVYGSHPTFVVCSATVANPKEHAQELIGVDHWEVVTEDGSPRGDKLFVMWNPPMTSRPSFASKKKAKEYKALIRQNRVTPAFEQSYAERMRKKLIEEGGTGEENRRSSPIVEVALLLAEFIQHGLRCLAFCKTRKLCELVLTYTRETLKVTAPHLIHTLKSYRAGYTPADRREIEADLFAGRLRGVCATNALELGVDVGSLDATLHLGYPGSVASLWQQSGRAGRRITDRGSLSIYVGFGGPLDQYFMRDPKRLFGRPIENAQVDSRNWKCLLRHLACAAVENPLRLGEDDVYFGAGLSDALNELTDKGRLGRSPKSPDGALHYIGVERSPSKGMSLRAIDPEKFVVVNTATNEIIEEVEASKAFYEVYEGSIYMHQGKTYLIDHLDLETKVARCHDVTVRYYTKTRDMCEVSVIGGNLAYPGKAPDPAKYPFTTAKCGRANVTMTWLGFVKIWRGTGEVFDMVDLNLPPVTYMTQAAWVRVPHEVRLEVGEGFREGLHAAAHAILNVLPLYVMCSPNDIGCECASAHDTRFRPERLLVYDKQPDGIGIAVQARPMFAELLQAALEMLTACDCTTPTGCPGCVHHMGCGEYNECLDKDCAIVILKGVIAAEAVRKEQQSQEPEVEEVGAGEGNGSSKERADGSEPRGAARRPEVVHGKDHTWDDTLKSIEELLPAEGGFNKGAA